MTEQEQINAEVQTRVSSLEATFKTFMDEMRDFKTEMRDRDKQRAAEIMELRQRQDAAQAKHDADMKSMDAKIDRLGDKIQTLVITAVVGFGAILVAVISALK